MKNSSKLRVADFFCGGGGFSEGFRQAGFDVCFALDIWQPAIDTFQANKPNAKVLKEDIVKISNLPDEEFHSVVPDVEVIIGSPPCVAFSNSNKSGGADKTLAIKLLKAFLKIIARKKYKKDSILQYWALENVPNISKYIKPEYAAEELGLEGDWKFRALYPNSGIYNAKHYGAPTNRKRFLCGEFPAIVETNSNCHVLPLRTVLTSLGDPIDNSVREIKDCNYPGLKMPSSELTDHFYEHIIPEFEWEKAKRAKQDKGYMGKMSFPENLNNPARTIMATMSSCSRESMILARKNEGYRLPTVREVASMMSFPIDYRFYGKTKSVKYRLVGNAVPPKLSFALAKAILLDLGMEIPGRYIRIKHDSQIDFFDLNNTKIPLKEEKPKSDLSKFKYHIPYLIYSAYRVELTNHHSDFEKRKIKWDAEIHYSQGKDKANVFTPKLNIEALNEKQQAKVNKFIEDKMKELTTQEDFQKIHCLTNVERQGLLGPFELLSQVREIIDTILSNEESKSAIIETSEKPGKLPISIVVGYVILNKLMNHIGGL